MLRVFCFYDVLKTALTVCLGKVIEVYLLNKSFMKKIILIATGFLIYNNTLLAQSIAPCFKGLGVANTFTIGINPWSITKADFNNDGKLDIVSANFGSANISVALGLSNGNFSSPVLYLTGANPMSIDCSDFNNDGNIDLAIANFNSNNISVLLGSGTGIFSSAVNYTVGTNPRSVFCADLNNDSKVDLVVANGSSNTISILMGSGTGLFSAFGNQNVGSGPSSVIVKDINNDGLLDAITANRLSGTISVLQGLGTGGFSAAVNYTVGNSPWSVSSTDFNGDGNNDLAIANGTSSTISVLLGSPSGTFAAATTYLAGTEPRYIKCLDINNDGKKDLLTANYTSNDVSILLGTGLGTFYPKVDYPVGYNTISLADGDFNNDGKTDLAVLNYGSNAVSVFFGSLDNGSFGTLSYFAGNSALDLVNKDFNHDGIPDIASASGGNDQVSFLLGLGSGTFSTPVTYNVGYTPSSLVSEDFNGDGNPDVAVANYNSHDVNVILGTGTATPSIFGASFTLSVGQYPSAIASADFDNDGVMDLVTANIGANISVLIGMGNGTFLPAVNYSAGTNPYDIAVADFNNDGNIDIAVANGGSVGEVVVLLNSGTGLFSLFGSYGNDIGTSITSADINSDGNMDIISANEIADNVQILFGQGNGALVPSSVSYIAEINPYDVLATDVNGDSKMDLAIANYGSHSISFLFGYGNGVFTTATNHAAGVNPYRIASGDYNNDGKMDLGIADGSTTLKILLNQGPVMLLSGVTTQCSGTSFSVTANGVNNYLWSNGSTANTISVGSAASQNLFVTGYNNSNNCTSILPVKLVVDNTCQDVWPGDANSDGTADNLDVLELGLHYTQTGPARASISNSWQSYIANNWSGTITNGSNVNHSDCNGDGIIDNNDTLAIYNNYGLTHTFKSPEQTVSNPQLSIIPDQTMVAKGTWGTCSVYLGDASTQISNINGVAFTINFDQTLIEPNSFYIEYPTSFLNAANQNLKFNKPDFSNGIIYTATTHTNNTNVTGNGKIAIVHYKIKSTLITDAVLNISLVQAKQSNASGVLISLTAGSATVAAIGASVGLDELQGGNTFAVYPNPATHYVTIQSTTALQKIELISVTGQVILSEPATGNQHKIDLSAVVNGVYFVTVTGSDNSIARKKIVVQH